MKTSRSCLFALLACVSALVGCDHATKVAAESALRDRAPLPLLRGVLDLSYTENHDIAFDAFARLSLHPVSAVLVAGGLAVLAAIVAAWVHARRAGWAVHLGFACIVAGAMGNLIDRATRGHVIDFIHVRFWPVFNVADVLVVAGVALLLWAHRGATAAGGGGPGARALR